MFDFSSDYPCLILVIVIAGPLLTLVIKGLTSLARSIKHDDMQLTCNSSFDDSRIIRIDTINTDVPNRNNSIFQSNVIVNTSLYDIEPVEMKSVDFTHIDLADSCKVDPKYFSTALCMKYCGTERPKDPKYGDLIATSISTEVWDGLKWKEISTNFHDTAATYVPEATVVVTHCPSCGAPVKKSRHTCPYCEVPYPTELR